MCVFGFVRKEIAEGGEILKTKMLKYLPKIALFNGKGIYEVFCGHKNFNFGLQPDPFPGCPNTVSGVDYSSYISHLSLSNLGQ